MPLIPLSKPDLALEDIEAAVSALRGERLSMGPALLEFERELAARTKRPFAVGVSSGAAAIEISLRALDVGPEDEVILPAFAYAAAIHAVMHIGASPIFVDCDPATLNLCPRDLERKLSPRTRAVVFAASFGNPIGLAEVVAICDRAEVATLEQASEGLGSRTRHDLVGKFGRVAALSFGPNRPVSCGEGGAIVSHDDRIAATCRALRNQGRVDRQSYPDQAPELGMLMAFAYDGYDARMPEACAALGASQLRRLDAIVETRRSVAEAYLRRLAGHPDLILPTISEEATISWPVFWVRLSDRFGAGDRDAIVDGLHRHDIGAGNHHPAMHLLPHVRNRYGTEEGMCPVAERFAQRTVTLPMFTSMSEGEVEAVCRALEVVLARHDAAR